MVLVTDIVAAVAGDIGDAGASPLPVVLTEPGWNVGTLRHRLEGRVGDALMAQRNRLRVESRTTGLRKEASRARHGLSQSFSFLGSRMASKDDDDGR